MIINAGKKLSFCICLLISCVVALTDSWSADKSQGFETPPVLKASADLPKVLLASPHYRISQRVKNDGYMNHYSVQSKYGMQEVRGKYFLIKLISEIDALEFLEKNYPSSTVAGDAAMSAGKGIVTAPINAANKVYDTVTDSDELERTAKAIPGGVVNIFSLAASGISSAAEYAYDAGKSAASGDSARASAKIGDGVSVLEDAALNFVGYNDAFRELAKTLKVDPYTENQLLQSELKRVSTIQTSIKVGAKFAPSIPSIPGVGEANKFLGYSQNVATYEDPKKVEATNEKMLRALSAKGSDDKLGTAAEALMSNTAYTPPMRMAVISALTKMKDVSGIEQLTATAANAKSREGAQFYLQAIGKLASIHGGKEPFAKIISDTTIPAALTGSNQLVIPLPVDYLVWTEEVATILTRFKNSASRQGKKSFALVLVGGLVSPRCKAEMIKLGADEVKQLVTF